MVSALEFVLNIIEIAIDTKSDQRYSKKNKNSRIRKWLRRNK